MYWGVDGRATQNRVKVSPQVPAWQRRMGAPLHTLMTVYGQTRFKGQRLKPPWKPLVLLGPND